VHADVDLFILPARLIMRRTGYGVELTHSQSFLAWASRSRRKRTCPYKSRAAAFMSAGSPDVDVTAAARCTTLKLGGAWCPSQIVMRRSEERRVGRGCGREWVRW